jgi:predicted phage tail protein
MNDENTDASGTMSSSRLSQFEAEVGKLKVTGGGANPERLGAQWGVGLTILGFVVIVISWWSALDAKGDGAAVSALRAEVFGMIGVGLVVVGIVIWARNSLTRYLRYWIIRLVYEQREQTEQLIQALRDEK